MRHHHGLQRSIASTCVAVAVAVAGGCAHVNHLREAQDAFNQAAALENTYRFDPKSIASSEAALGATVQQPMMIESGYSAVVVSLAALDKDDEVVTKLRQDKLYGNVLTLKAMAYWRLHKHDQAKAAAAAALAEGLPPGSRDHAFVVALPGLVKSDQAYARLYGPQPAGSADDAKRLADISALIDSAGVDLDAARKTLPDEHPMRVYLSLAELASLKNLSDACLILNGKRASPALACFETHRIDCRAQKAARAALALGADAAAVKRVGEGSLSTDPVQPLPAECR